MILIISKNNEFTTEVISGCYIRARLHEVEDFEQPMGKDFTATRNLMQ